MAKARATRRKQEEIPMIDEKKTQEKAVETMTVWADANQRVLSQMVEFGATAAKESVRLYGELQQSAIEALREPQNVFKLFEVQMQAWTRSAERLQTSAEQAGKGIQETCTGVASKMKEVYSKN
ncbi:MAG: hypothetical protein HY615_11815 [Candidatus Rokubacteria bacterium]|nr:hypothetical protein [Candidatus Rokubacteria bacterium]